MTGEFSIAVHALVFLSHKNVILSSEALAENICTNAARVRKVMAALKRAGLIETKEGTDGGYAFKAENAKTTLYTVAKALNVSFVHTSWKSGNPDMECLVASGMADVMSGLYEDMNHICYEHLKNITIAGIEKKLFENK